MGVGLTVAVDPFPADTPAAALRWGKEGGIFGALPKPLKSDEFDRRWIFWLVAFSTLLVVCRRFREATAPPLVSEADEEETELAAVAVEEATAVDDEEVFKRLRNSASLAARA